MQRQLHDLVQGSEDWLKFRAEHFGSSEASAMLGLSKNTTRTELLNIKSTGLSKEFSKFVQEQILDKGHLVEAKTRPIAEKIVGEELAPVIYSFGKLSASCDGLDFMTVAAWENKQFNKTYFELVKNGDLPEEHWPQCQQVLYVTGAEKLLFTISDGTEENTASVWVYPDNHLVQVIIDGWNQFQKDLDNHVPTVAIEPPKAQPVLALPALFIHAKGEITTSNMQEYGEALAKRLTEVRSIALVTDQDFANAKDAAKLLRDNIQQAKLAKDAMLAQTVTVGEAARMIDTWCEDMRLTAKQLENDVEREDLAKKQAMIMAANVKYNALMEASEAETKPLRIVLGKPDFASALKGKRNYASMQGAIDDLLANSTILLDNTARDIRAKQAWLKEQADGYQFLFADLQSIISKPLDDLQMLAKSRIAEHKLNEAAKAEAQRAKIQAEEEAKAREKVEAEARAQAAIVAKELAEKYALEKEALVIAQAQYEAELMKPVELKAPELRAVVVEKQDVLAAFLKSRNFGNEENKVRAILVEFVKFSVSFSNQ